MKANTPEEMDLNHKALLVLFLMVCFAFLFPLLTIMISYFYLDKFVADIRSKRFKLFFIQIITLLQWALALYCLLLLGQLFAVTWPNHNLLVENFIKYGQILTSVFIVFSVLSHYSKHFLNKKNIVSC